MTLTAQNISCKRGGKAVLIDVSVTVAAGRVLALVGPNGAGKSTLLAALSGDIPVNAGEVLMDKQPLSSWNPREMAQHRAVLLQHNDVAFAFTAAEVVAMGRSPWPADPDVDAAHIESAMTACDIGHLANRAYRTLSGGERARVSLARVLAQDTATVLLDEPTAALDLAHQEDVMRIARRLAQDGRAVAVVLHDLSLAAAYADEVAVLHSGQVYAYGSPHDVLDSPVIDVVYGIATHRLSTPDGHHVIVPRRSDLAAPADTPLTPRSTT